MGIAESHRGQLMFDVGMRLNLQGMVDVGPSCWPGEGCHP